MNSRERILLGVLLSILIVGGAGAVFHYVFFEDYLTLRAQNAADRKKLDDKKNELAAAVKEQEVLLTRNPRLEVWKQVSLPELAPKPGGGKHSPKEIADHLANIRSEYQAVLNGLLEKHRFTSVQIIPKNIDTKTVDSKGGSSAKDKTPVYTRIPFTVQGTATYGSIVDMLRDFHSQPLLQEVRTLSITKPQTPRQGAPQKALDVTMTVEVLMVTGAESRDTLMPKIKNGDKLVLAQPEREYGAMANKDPFYGKIGGTGDNLTPERKEPAEVVLRFVKLTMIAQEGTRRWQATLYNQGTGEERPVSMLNDNLVIKDLYQTPTFEGRLAYLDGTDLVFSDKDQKKFYLMHIGDMMFNSLDHPLSTKELEKYKLKPKGSVAVGKSE